MNIVSKMPTWLRRVRCWLTLNHIDPGVILIGQRLYACKRCGKVWPT